METKLSSIGERLIYARELRGIKSQQALANLVGVRQSAIGNIESNARKRPRDLLKIASVLRVSPEWLETGEGPMDEPEKFREDVLELAEEMQKLSPEQVSKIRALVLAFNPVEEDDRGNVYQRQAENDNQHLMAAQERPKYRPKKK